MAKAKAAKKEKQHVEQAPAAPALTNSTSVAAALGKHFPKDAAEIVKVMRAASKSKSFGRKLDRVARVLGGAA